MLASKRHLPVNQMSHIVPEVHVPAGTVEKYATDGRRAAHVAELAAVAKGLSQRSSLITALTCVATRASNKRTQRTEEVSKWFAVLGSACAALTLASTRG